MRTPERYVRHGYYHHNITICYSQEIRASIPDLRILSLHLIPVCLGLWASHRPLPTEC